MDREDIMDFSKLGSLIASVAPTLATTVGGPLAGLAVKTISNVLLGRPDGSPQELETAVQNATPEQMAQLRKVDADFKIRMKELDIDLEKISVQDRGQAREMAMKTGNWTARILSFLIVGGFFACLAWMLFRGMPQSGTEAILMMLGALTNTVTAVVSFHFGSNSAARDKDRNSSAELTGVR
jgi:hypothetical protein